MVAFVPEAQTLFTVVHGTESGIPADKAACLAGACQRLEETTLPKNNSLTSSPLIPAFSKAPFMAALPSWMAENDERTPPKLPMGVLTAETI